MIKTLRQAGFDGHDIEQAENGVDALAKIDADAPDVVLTDWNMPEMTGIELAHAMKGLAGNLSATRLAKAAAELETAAADAGAEAAGDLQRELLGDAVERFVGELGKALAEVAMLEPGA